MYVQYLSTDDEDFVYEGKYSVLYEGLRLREGDTKACQLFQLQLIRSVTRGRKWRARFIQALKSIDDIQSVF